MLAVDYYILLSRSFDKICCIVNVVVASRLQQCFVHITIKNDPKVIGISFKDVINIIMGRLICLRADGNISLPGSKKKKFQPWSRRLPRAGLRYEVIAFASHFGFRDLEIRSRSLNVELDLQIRVIHMG